MPNSNSAKKRLRTSLKARMRNRARKSRVRTCERSLREKIAANDAAGARAALDLCFSVLDKAAKAGSIHRNTADRKKSRLAAALKTVAETAAE